MTEQATTHNRHGFPWMLLVFLAIPFAIAALGALVTIGSVDGWYAQTPHVAWTPPNWIFGPVWTILYTLIGISGWLIWRRRHNPQVKTAYTYYVAQLVFNALWTPVFFGAYPFIGATALWLAAAIIIMLDILLIITIIKFRSIYTAAALLLLPYLAWVLFATTLNIGDALLLHP